MGSGYYRKAQICLNGHVITTHWDTLGSKDEFPVKFCSQCGQATITECPKCSRDIKGSHVIPGVNLPGRKPYSLPDYCPHCGQGYPWTVRRLQAAVDLVEEMEELSDLERETLKRALGDLTKDTPQTELAAMRLRKLMLKVGKESYSGLKSVLVGIITAAAKKQIFDP